MPVQPSTYHSGPVSPQQLNTDLYSFNGYQTGANGILFHVNRPLLSETVLTGGTAYTSLTQNPVDVAGLKAYTVVDTTALFGIGADRPGTYSTFTFSNYVAASAGSTATIGGNWLAWEFPNLGAVTVPPGGVGAVMFLNGTFRFPGVFQYGNTQHSNIPWYLDLLGAGAGSASTWQPGFWWETPSTPAIAGSTTDTSGGPTRMGWLWMGVSQNGGTVASVPSPQFNWGTVTSAALNSSVGSILTLLNNPPQLRVSNNNAQTFTTGVHTVLNFGSAAPTVDPYGSWDTTTFTYTAGIPGLYLFCPTIAWGTTSAAGLRISGLRTGANTNNDYQGATYIPTPVGPGVSGVGFTVTSQVRILNLNAGDKVQAFGVQTSGGNLSLYTGVNSRLIGTYMAPVAPTGSVFTYGIPDATFRWQAGALSGTALTAALNQHLGTDLAFLMNKPYFTGYQQVSQGFGTAVVFNQVTIDTVGTLPRSGNGDNYAGWSTANSWYVSQLAGWYLVIADLYAVTPQAGTIGTLTGSLVVSSSGSITPSNAHDIYQQVAYPVAGGGVPVGATCIGLYYLLPGEHVYPALQANGWGGTWGTYVNTSTTATVFSQFSCFWVAE